MEFNESFWVAVSIALFIVLFLKYTKKGINDFLVNRSSFIAHRLQEVFSLAQQADIFLQEQVNIHQSSLKKAKEIMELAEKEILLLKLNAEKDLEDRLNLKTDAIIKQIASNEEKYLNNLHFKAVQLAIKITVTILQDQKNEKISGKIMDESLDYIQLKANSSFSEANN
jgi:F0F1-type ATP synthase membrane subunit b/b'